MELHGLISGHGYGHGSVRYGCFGYCLIIIFGFLVSGKRAMGTGRASVRFGIDV